jgi:hypothetical protein
LCTPKIVQSSSYLMSEGSWVGSAHDCRTKGWMFKTPSWQQVFSLKNALSANVLNEMVHNWVFFSTACMLGHLRGFFKCGNA